MRPRPGSTTTTPCSARWRASRTWRFVNSIAQGDRIDTIEIMGNADGLLKEQREDVEKWNKKLG